MAKQMISVVIVAATLGGTASFAPSSSFVPSHRSLSVIPASTNHVSFQPHSLIQPTHISLDPLQMCICINCERVTNCMAYHFVEEQHSQPHINKNPTWEPRNGSPTIQVHIRPDDNQKADSELGKMWEEHEDQTRQAEEASGETTAAGGDDTALFGEKQYDLSGATSYEYDVVECEDFVEDKDAWVKNMPEEIRIANPDFVST